jgi:hypothetical protein
MSEFDDRGVVCVVRCSEIGPRVTFWWPPLCTALRLALASGWANSDGCPCYPNQFFVQKHPGEWEAA